MQVLNYMEGIVSAELDKLFAQDIKDACKCQRCKSDMMCWALNRLPPKYVVSEKGRIYTKLNEQHIQFHVDVIRELTKAILYVSKNPQH